MGSECQGKVVGGREEHWYRCQSQKVWALNFCPATYWLLTWASDWTLCFSFSHLSTWITTFLTGNPVRNMELTLSSHFSVLSKTNCKVPFLHGPSGTQYSYNKFPFLELASVSCIHYFNFIINKLALLIFLVSRYLIVTVAFPVKELSLNKELQMRSDLHREKWNHYLGVPLMQPQLALYFF